MGEGVPFQNEKTYRVVRFTSDHILHPNVLLMKRKVHFLTLLHRDLVYEARSYDVFFAESFLELATDAGTLWVLEELAYIYLVEYGGEVFKRHPEQARVAEIRWNVVLYAFGPRFGAVGEVTCPLEVLPDVA